MVGVLGPEGARKRDVAGSGAESSADTESKLYLLALYCAAMAPDPGGFNAVSKEALCRFVRDMSPSVDTLRAVLERRVAQ